MLSFFGKERISIGSAPDNDIVVQGPGIAPRHAVIERRNRDLFYIDLGAGPSSLGGRPVPPNQPQAVDFRAPLQLGQVPLPLSHPALVSMILGRGTLDAPPGHFHIGREPEGASLVVANGAVSGKHATVMLDRMHVVDHGSTSGTYVGGQRIPPNTPVPFDPNGVLTFGPVPIPVALLQQFAGGRVPAQQSAPHSPAPYGAPPPQAGPGPGPAPVPGPGPGGGHELQPPPKKHRTIIGDLSMLDGAANIVTIGRTPENQIVVPHAQVSSKHAVIHNQNGSLFLEDKGSANGTYVRGQRLPPNQRVPVAHGERVYIGPMPLVIQVGGDRLNVVVEDSANWAGRPLYEVEAWDLLLEVPDRDNKAQMKVLLDHVSFKALPGDMIALMGPSGAGKTTLLMTLNGYLPPTAGQVRINGEDLYIIYDALRGSIGYVPQDDIVHPELTVFEAVRYSAKFRLPPDYSDEEIDQRVEQTLQELGLEAVKNLEIGKPEKKVLSGGQRKRVNIALELVTDPVILFLDEPTSGLAADDTTALINLLADLTKRTGKTIIMTIHQPAKDEFEKFNLAFIMGYGGIPGYFGPTGEPAYRFFGNLLERENSPYRVSATHPHGKRIDNPRDMFDMINVRERFTLDEMKKRAPETTRNTARLEAARGWRAEFFQPSQPVFNQMFTGRRAVGTEPAMRGVPHRAGVALFRQLMLLMSRYWKVKIRDRAGAAIMFLQAPVIGIMLAFVFAGQKEAVPFWCLGALQDLSKRAATTQTGGSADLLTSMLATKDHAPALFFVVVSCVWFGTSNAAREIVTERAIYLRERMVNLNLVNYVLSKYILLAMICVLQCTMLLGIVFFALGFNGGLPAFLAELGMMVAVSVNACALGLLLSTVVASAEAAMALTPIALIPQVVLGGLMVPMTTNTLLGPLMYVMPARWGFQGSIAFERLAVKDAAAWMIDLHDPTRNSPPDYVFNGKFQCAIAQMASDKMIGAWGFTQWDQFWIPAAVLCSMTALIVVLMLVVLKRRDPV